MDIYFCDECGSRVTDLDLRAGKGMRQRNDQICSQCVGNGLAAAWLTRSAAAAAAAAASVAVVTSAPAAIAASDPISIGRDRARTQRDDPFADDEVLEPAPMARIPPPSASPAPFHVTDALPAKKPAPVSPPPHPLPASESSPFGDGFADAAGGMGALAGPLPKRPDPQPGDDDLADQLDPGEDLDAMAATSPTAGVDVSPVSAAKAETAATTSKPEAKKGTSSRRVAQGQNQKKGSTTSRRTSTASPSRRTPPSAMGSPKVMVISLISCAVIAIFFFLVVVPGINENKAKPAPVIREDLLVTFGGFVKDADCATKDAMCHPDDLVKQRTAIAAIHTMQSEFSIFEKAAKKTGWKEEGFEQQLENMRIHDIKGRMKPISERIFILEQQGQH